MVKPNDQKAKTREFAEVYFFNSPGARNTSKVIKAVKRRIRSRGISKIQR